MSEGFKGPTSYTTQPEARTAICGDFDLDALNIITAAFYADVIATLGSAGIPIIISSWRTKTPERIVEKINQQQMGQGGRDWPIADIYGVRIILDESVREDALTAIRDRFPMPDEFPWGLKTCRSGGNRYSHPDYNAVRMNVMLEGDRIGEIAFMTSEELAIEDQTRETYRSSRGNASK